MFHYSVKQCLIVFFIDLYPWRWAKLQHVKFYGLSSIHKLQSQSQVDYLNQNWIIMSSYKSKLESPLVASMDLWTWSLRKDKEKLLLTLTWSVFWTHSSVFIVCGWFELSFTGTFQLTVKLFLAPTLKKILISLSKGHN